MPEDRKCPDCGWPLVDVPANERFGLPAQTLHKVGRAGWRVSRCPTTTTRR